MLCLQILMPPVGLVMKQATIITAIDALEARLENHCDTIGNVAWSNDADFLDELVANADYEDDFEKDLLEEVIEMKRALVELKGVLKNG